MINRPDSCDIAHFTGYFDSFDLLDFIKLWHHHAVCDDRADVAKLIRRNEAMVIKLGKALDQAATVFDGERIHRVAAPQKPQLEKQIIK